jgi:hypothetical protein
VVPPNQRMQPDAAARPKISAILECELGTHAIPIYRGGAADAPGVGRARAAHWIDDQHIIQPRDYRIPTANARESGIRALSRGTHPVPGQGITGNARRRHPRAVHPAAVLVGTGSPAAPSDAIPKHASDRRCVQPR